MVQQWLADGAPTVWAVAASNTVDVPEKVALDAETQRIAWWSPAGTAENRLFVAFYQHQASLVKISLADDGAGHAILVTAADWSQASNSMAFGYHHTSRYES